MRRVVGLIVSVFLIVPSIALAQLEQPTGVRIPSEPGCDSGRPTGLAATFACVCVDDDVCNIGDPCPSEDSCHDGVYSECETTMWHAFNDNTCIPSQMSGLDPRAEASVTPETFSPVCPLTFTVVSRGTALFRDAFGWYNATGSEPDTSDLHVMLGCDTTEGDTAVLDINGHPDYRGGEIGFFLVTPEEGEAGACADGDCCASIERATAGQGHIFYSERRFNPDHSGDESFIHLLIFDSHLWPHKFYFAWEDIYNIRNNDFTDFVTSVSGVECAGGGAVCDTGEEGVCEYGVTQCEGETLECIGLYDAEDERCDGLDNNCNGEIDDGAECPGENQICHNGSCVPHCELSDEFTCSWGFICDAETGFCVEEDCQSVDCPSHQVCRGGHCIGGCDDVVCPHGLSCRLGNCVDPCDGVECVGAQICSEGVCVNGCGQCNGLVCEGSLECNMETGECQDPACAAVDCGPGTHCRGGECVDDCDGAVCPGGQVCEDGRCRWLDEGEDGGPRPDGGPGDGGPGDGGPGDSGPGEDGGDAGSGDDVNPSCGCRSGGSSQGQQLGLLLVSFLTVFAFFWLRDRSSLR